jgi:hypothetical protein
LALRFWIGEEVAHVGYRSKTSPLELKDPILATKKLINGFGEHRLVKAHKLQYSKERGPFLELLLVLFNEFELVFICFLHVAVCVQSHHYLCVENQVL